MMNPDVALLDKVLQETGALRIGDIIAAARSEEHARYASLEAAARTLVEMYVANRSTRREFITCIAPRSWRDPAKRAADKTWAAWDALRVALGEEIPS